MVSFCSLRDGDSGSVLGFLFGLVLMELGSSWWGWGLGGWGELGCVVELIGGWGGVE